MPLQTGYPLLRCRLVVFGIRNLKKMANSIVLYVNHFLLHMIIYVRQFALYANSVRDCEFQNYCLYVKYGMNCFNLVNIVL